MTEHEAPDVTEPAKQASVTMSWPRAWVTYLVLALVLGLISTFGIMATIPLAFILILGAVPYTLVATFFIVRKRRAARRALDAMTDVDVEMSLTDFGGRSQKLSLLNGITLGFLGLLLLVTTANAIALPDSTIFVLALVAVFSAVEIVVNVGWIYSGQTTLAEEYALKTRTHAWKLIRANRWLGWAIWYIGAGIAGLVLVTQPSSFLP